jgi:sulfoxide reductase catalytic subunit YedY
MYRFKTDLKYSDTTPRADFLNRRQIIAGAAGMMAAGGIAAPAVAAKLDVTRGGPYSADLEPVTKEVATTYNNFYEFGTGKNDPAKNAHKLTTDPWSVEVSGHVNNPGAYAYDDILKGMALEERIYRFRCVEAWSMVVPWVGFSLSEFIKRADPTGNAKYLKFETLVRPEEMHGQKTRIVPWPYTEGLRMDEAMHPLTMVVVGMYGETLPNQNGAPIRIIIPWKYGFKSIKSIVSMEFTEEPPLNTWQEILPREYGFYANVNPEVDHPRWSQATERPVGGGLFAKKQPTLMFNGYADEVAGLYAGMDLRKNY